MRQPTMRPERRQRPSVSHGSGWWSSLSDQDAFERGMASLYDAMLDESHWPAASALIEEACGVTGHALMVGEGAQDERRALYVGLYHQGRRREDLEREYLRDVLSDRRMRAARAATA